MNRKILCVDDEEAILKGFRLHLRKDYELFTANSGEEGLQVFQSESPFAVVLSDMRMPGMDGASMLAAIKDLDPDVVSMLLTGHADFESAMSAVNDGCVFRMLSKPCPPDRLKQALEDGLRQHELIIAEKVLLEQTLKGAIDALTQALATAKPLFFGRAMRIRRLGAELAELLDEKNVWRIEVAAIFSQLASITLPESISQDVYEKKSVLPEVQAIVDRFPQVMERLLGNIPRLEEVLDILTGIEKKPDVEASDPEGIQRASSIIKVALDYDYLIETGGYDQSLVVETLRNRPTEYDPVVTEALQKLFSVAENKYRISEVAPKNFAGGMRLAEPLVLENGFLVAPAGTDISRNILEIVRNHIACSHENPFAKKTFKVTVRAFVSTE
jgi:response regulator RpfG family c-di-GMP phosphodiesterase